MNDALVKSVAAPEIDDEPRNAPAPRSSAKPEWIWIGLVYGLLSVSGGLREWRDWQFQSLNKVSENAPFPLKEFPKVLGDWREVEGSETALDTEVARVAGSSDHLIRTYINEKSGDRVVVLLVYGLAYLVWPHTPTGCYPAAGFKGVPPARDVNIPVPETSIKARFREENFAKYQAGAGIYQQVYYSLRNAGEWGASPQDNWKAFRYHPGMFKIQVQRQVPAVGLADNSSVEELLGRIVQEIERRTASRPRNQEHGGQAGT